MRKIFENYKRYFIKKHSNQLTFRTKRQTNCFDIADNTATAGIYGEWLPEVGKRRRRHPPSSDLKVPNVSPAENRLNSRREFKLIKKISLPTVKRAVINRKESFSRC